jgi:2-oxo-4-hydroxy-4-carboxy-5-ureidoimidazoline decarboxylase
MNRVSLESLNASDKARFTAALGDIYEHAPWVAQTVYGERPFGTLAALHDAMMSAVRAAPADQRLALI